MIKYWIVKSSIIFIYELLYVFYYPLSIICDLWSVIYDLWCLIYCLLIMNSYFLMTVIHYMICMISPHHTTPQHTTPPHTPHTPTPHHHTHTHTTTPERDETRRPLPPPLGKRFCHPHTSGEEPRTTPPPQTARSPRIAEPTPPTTVPPPPDGHPSQVH